MRPHDVDVKALLRPAVLYTVPTACNKATADYYLISSSLRESDDAPIRRFFHRTPGGNYRHSEVEGFGFNSILLIVVIRVELFRAGRADAVAELGF